MGRRVCRLKEEKAKADVMWRGRDTARLTLARDKEASLSVGQGHWPITTLLLSNVRSQQASRGLLAMAAGTGLNGLSRSRRGSPNPEPQGYVSSPKQPAGGTGVPMVGMPIGGWGVWAGGGVLSCQGSLPKQL